MSEEKTVVFTHPGQAQGPGPGHARHRFPPNCSPATPLISTAAATPLFHKSNLPEEVVQFLVDMDQKLDRLIGLLSQDQVRTDFFHGNSK